jgi:SAM-dependent methyltransferase
MYHCLQCGTDFDESRWSCPHCAYTPVVDAGYLSFAPHLKEGSGGFDGDFHHFLDQAQERNFWFRSRSRLFADLVRQWFPQARNALEIGCGTGYVLANLREALPQARFSGSEVSAVGLQYAARRLGPAVSLLQMDAQAIPFSEEFDLIAACDVLEHLEDDVKSLREIHRALKPGGGVLLSVPQHPQLWSEADIAAHHRRRYKPRELSAKCRGVGFEVVVDTSFVFSLLPLMATQRWLRRHEKGYSVAAELSMPDWLNYLLFLVLDIERRFIHLGARFPVGGSRVVIGLKKHLMRG